MALKRDSQNKMIGGVAAGISKHLGIDTTITRIIFVLTFLFWGIGPLVYLILWFIMPKDGE